MEGGLFKEKDDGNLATDVSIKPEGFSSFQMCHFGMRVTL